MSCKHRGYAPCESCLEEALQAMHDLCVWTLCQGFEDPVDAVFFRGYKAGLDAAEEVADRD